MAKKNKKKSKKQPLKKKITKNSNRNAKQIFDPSFTYLKRSKEPDKSDDEPILCLRNDSIKKSTAVVNKKKKKPKQKEVKGKGEKFTVPKVTLNPEQEETLKKMLDWWHNSSNQTFEITGAAGTGKTTLIRYLVAKLGLRKDEVLFTAYVGKATLAMTRNGLNAKTIHTAICTFSRKPRRDKNGKQIVIDGKPQYERTFKKLPALDPEIQLIVVDEAAMVPYELATWLLSYGIRVIALGDLNQLPPVFGEGYFLHNIDSRLTEIMRQSSESPIPHLAKAITEGKFIPSKELNIMDKIFVIRSDHLTDEMLTKADIILTQTNRQRDYLNKYLREGIYGRTQPYPMIGDKMVCRHNNWDKAILKNIYLVNGMIGYVEDIDLESLTKNSIYFDFRPEFTKKEVFRDVTADLYYLHLDTKYKKDYISLQNFDLFEYGYAITCHLAQGSEYANILIDMRNSYFRDRLFYRQWLYTAVTRATDTVTIIS